MKAVKFMLVLAMVASFAFLGCNNYSPLSGGLVNASLLEDPKVEPVAATTVKIKEKVLFAFDSFKLDAEADATVEMVAALMAKYPDTQLALAGHTDKYGADDYNQTLSENRANAVKDSLVDEGVAAERIASVKGFGKTQLIPNLTNRENRRVIILSYGDK